MQIKMIIQNKEAELFELLSENKGKDKVIIYLVKEKTE